MHPRVPPAVARTCSLSLYLPHSLPPSHTHTHRHTHRHTPPLPVPAIGRRYSLRPCVTLIPIIALGCAVGWGSDRLVTGLSLPCHPPYFPAGVATSSGSLLVRVLVVVFGECGSIFGTHFAQQPNMANTGFIHGICFMYSSFRLENR